MRDALARRPRYAGRGMVATTQPLAAEAGLHLLRAGGNAVDAALATAAALTVVEPTSNGLGGDLFAIVWAGGGLHGLNASGAAPAALDLDSLGRAGGGHRGRSTTDTGGQQDVDRRVALPSLGWAPVTVPGQVRGWADLHGRFGALPFADVLAPAVELARRGFPLSPVVAANWARAIESYRRRAEPLLGEWFATFAPDGFAPRPGARWRSEAHARTLESIAASHGEAFYTGDLADAIDAHSRATGGWLCADDLAAHRGEWVTPLAIAHRGHLVHELPPNGQGIAALIALGVLGDADEPDEGRRLHRRIEAMKLGFTDAFAHVADPRTDPVDVDRLLDPGRLAGLRGTITERASEPTAEGPGSGTVYLAAADDSGVMVSLIQSNYRGFGSGIVVPGTGIALHNRGCGFVLDPGHPNVLAPGKRPYHTIIPGFLSRPDGQPVGPFGVMGGFMQPQGHLQVVERLLAEGLDPQAALDAPRWQWLAGRRVEVEPQLPARLVAGLVERGHDVRVQTDPGRFGRGQVIRRLASGVFEGGTESRADGTIAAW